MYCKRVKGTQPMYNRDAFWSALQSLPQFVLETDANLEQATDWMIDQVIDDQCELGVFSNAQFRIVEEVFEKIIA